jgi:hypothetical protein
MGRYSGSGSLVRMLLLKTPLGGEKMKMVKSIAGVAMIAL